MYTRCPGLCGHAFAIVHGTLHYQSNNNYKYLSKKDYGLSQKCKFHSHKLACQLLKRGLPYKPFKNTVFASKPQKRQQFGIGDVKKCEDFFGRMSVTLNISVVTDFISKYFHILKILLFA